MPPVTISAENFLSTRKANAARQCEGNAGKPPADLPDTWALLLSEDQDPTLASFIKSYRRSLAHHRRGQPCCIPGLADYLIAADPR